LAYPNTFFNLSPSPLDGGEVHENTNFYPKYPLLCLKPWGSLKDTFGEAIFEGVTGWPPGESASSASGPEGWNLYQKDVPTVACKVYGVFTLKAV
jgi:hypothetical protein